MNSYPGKRTLDILVSGAACVALGPLMAGVAMATWLEDRGSLLFRQARIGAHRRPFTIIKFRSMRDHHVTRTGQWLRETGIDELPQFLNVLRGEMSAVGPRPLTEHDIDRLSWGDPDHDWRFETKPGITGLSQLYAGRGARASERLDKLYLKRQSLALDLQLIAASFVVNIVGKRQVRRWLRAT
jgi:lipopolysaccharide/colanic/teichoic acid biosynthesis glycosyltransferase